ncbi:bifunctional GNAT family N-acetyltransferase/class I SAM-dependent methyltransferase [Candidatus Allofournierella excrementigallinarum]|uniref:bifunctional GNAT family N-acetyltransferase/class I SAM-dependent methyltransferase n=1 Tax=Candidatus Allofournierella excrementigallinarum TaxID=2838592 RepID=UPI00374F26D7
MRIDGHREGERLALTLYKEQQPVGVCRLRLAPGRVELEEFFIDESWRGRGYGSFLLKQALHATGGFSACSLHAAPPPESGAAAALLRKFGFAPAGDIWLRRRAPDPSAVRLTHEFLASRLAPGGFFIDATCGNGHDTAFLCRLAGPEGKVLALDVQQKAVAATRARLEAEGLASIARVVQADHARLAQFAGPASADCVVFNFGYLPGADHALFTTPASSLPALSAALDILKPGGVLAACLYSGGPNGGGERNAVEGFFAALPLERYTVLACRFANWAPTAPLPCFVLKKQSKNAPFPLPSGL